MIKYSSKYVLPSKISRGNIANTACLVMHIVRSLAEFDQYPLVQVLELA